MTITVKKIGGSMAVLIPKAVAREMELREGTAIELTSNGDALVMRRQRRNRHRARRPLAKIVAQIKPGSYARRRKEFGGDKPVGKEIA